MANNGGDMIRRQNQSRTGDPQGLVHTAYYWGGALSSHVQLPVPSGSSDATSRAGTYNGRFAGEANSSTFALMPAYWATAGTVQSFDDPVFATGKFLDVNPSGACAGYYVLSSGLRRACYTDDNQIIRVLANPPGFDGADFRAVNTQGWFGGKVYGSGGSPAAVWKRLSNNSFDFLKVSDLPAWNPYSSRSAYIVGLTDAVSGNSDGPYAVGWIEPDATAGGQPFIWSVGGQKLRFVGTFYGKPEHVTNRSYDPTDPMVSFCGEKGATVRPYVWTGDPDPASANFGVASDMQAFFDKDYASAESVVVTGINSEYHYGGSGVTIDGAFQWMTTDSTWNFLTQLPELPIHTISTGSSVGGSVSDMRFVDGRFITVQKGFVPASGLPQVVLQVEELVASPTFFGFINFLAVRATGRQEDFGTFQRTTELWDWTKNGGNGGWDLTLAGPDYNLFMRTTFGAVSGWTDISKYVNQDSQSQHYRKVRARLTAKSVGIVPVANWRIGVEQLRVVYKL